MTFFQKSESAGQIQFRLTLVLCLAIAMVNLCKEEAGVLDPKGFV